MQTPFINDIGKGHFIENIKKHKVLIKKTIYFPSLSSGACLRSYSILSTNVRMSPTRLRNIFPFCLVDDKLIEF